MRFAGAISKGFFCLQIAAIFIAMLNSGCSSSDSSKPAALNPIVKKVDASNYINGKTFCETYKNITQSEFGRYIQVPIDYDHPETGSLEIYAYTLSPFNPKNPTYIYVDGGPGQNAHGMPEYLGGDFNEIRFDQRGLGCSAPATFQQYKDQSLYSSMNTVRDMDLIRKSYGIANWSIYGISYGTVPATMYGSHFPEATVSVVLEGVFGRSDQVHMKAYKAEKMNLALANLSPSQKTAFSNFVQNEDSKDAETVFDLIEALFYQDRGMATASQYLQRIFKSDGTIDRALIGRVRAALDERENRYPHPQQPGAVDENIMNIIYCKNLGYLNKMYASLQYNETSGFYSISSATERYKKICSSVGVTTTEEQPYKLEENKVAKPVYYFQGSHDGATHAIGALSHWKTIPQGKSYFMLAQKGGHNPNLTRISDKDSSRQPTPLSKAETQLFRASVSGLEILPSLIEQVNLTAESNQKWILYLTPNGDRGFMDELQGINRLLQPAL